MDGALDAEDTLIATLPRLGLREVPGLECDGLHLPHGDQDFGCGHQLGAVLWGRVGLVRA